MGEVGATVGELLVLTGQCAPGLSPVRATLLFARKPPPRAFDLALGLSEQSRVFDNAAIRIGGETIVSLRQPFIDPAFYPPSNLQAVV